jgi:hypothetical protein
MKFSRQIFCLIFLASSSFIHAYLSPSDLTLEKASAAPVPAETLYLKFQSRDADFLVFYDFEGSTLYLRYRLDRWDYDNDDLVASLRQGITYAIRLKSLKKLPEGEMPQGVAGAGLPRAVVTRKIRRIRDLYTGEFLSLNESALRDLRY